jgi:hypothetical protein
MAYNAADWMTTYDVTSPQAIQCQIANIILANTGCEPNPAFQSSQIVSHDGRRTTQCHRHFTGQQLPFRLIAGELNLDLILYGLPEALTQAEAMKTQSCSSQPVKPQS